MADKRDREWRRIRAIAGKHDDLLGLLAHIKSLPDRQSRRLLKQFTRDAQCRAFLDRITKIEGDAKLKDSEHIESSKDLVCEISWLARILLVYGEEVRQFIERRGCLSSAILSGDCSAAIEQLDELDLICGRSFWSMEARIAAYHFSGKNDDASAYCESVAASDTAGDYAKVMVHYWTERSRPKVSTQGYERMIDSLLAQIRADSDLLSGARYKLDRLYWGDDLVLEDVLAHTWNEGLVDKYITFVDVLSRGICSGSLGPQDALRLLPDITAVQRAVGDDALGISCTGLGCGYRPTDRQSSRQIFSMLEMYSKGDYTELLDRVRDGSRLMPGSFALMELAAIISVRAGVSVSDFFSGQAIRVIEAMAGLASVRGNPYPHQEVILKEASIASCLCWGRQAVDFVNRYTDGRGANDIKENVAAYFSMSGHPHNPLKRYFCKTLPDSGATLVSGLAKVYDAPITISVVEYDLGLSDSLHDFVGFNRARLRTAKRLLNDGFSSEVLKCLAQLDGRPLDPMDDLERSSIVLTNLLHCGYVEEAARYACRAILEEASTVYGLPFRLLIHSLRERSGGGLSHLIEVPIVVEAYYRAFPVDADDDLPFWVEEFLLHCGVDEPAQLAAMDEYSEGESKRRLIRFLDRCCSGQVIANACSVKSSEDVRRVRMGICGVLADIDHENSKVYQDEISTLVKEQHLESVSRDIEASKIYVNEARLREHIDLEVEELFGRMVDLRSKGLASVRIALVNQSMVIISDEGRSAEYELFTETFKITGTQFFQGDGFGLEFYLASRIRHGVIAGQIRTRPEQNGLALQRVVGEDGAVVYVRPEEMDGDLAEVLEAFSSALDEIIDDLVERRLQFGSRPSAGGPLFIPDFTQAKMRQVFAECSIVDDYDEFVSCLLDAYWEKTELCLEEVRQCLRRSVEPSVINLFDKLEADLAKRGLLNENIHVSITSTRTEVQHAFDRVVRWFYRVNSYGVDDFIPKLPIDLALGSAGEINPHFSGWKPVIEMRGEEKIPGKHLSSLVDIFLILFNNAIRHSRAASPSDLVFNMAVEVDGRRWLVDMSNSIPRGDYSRAVRDRTDRVIGAESSKSAARKDRGSGFAKIKKLCQVEFGSDLDVDVDVQDGKFSCSLSWGVPQ